MSAAAALVRAEAAGMELWLEDGRLRWRSRGAPSPDLLAALRVHRDELPALLAIDHDAGEVAAMAAHYAAPAGPPLPAHDPLAAGLLAGFRKSRVVPPAPSTGEA